MSVSVEQPSEGRFRSPKPTELTAEQTLLYTSITEGPRKTQAGVVPVVDAQGRLLGPFALMAIAPGLGEAVQAVGAALRFHGRLNPLTRELATLMVAAFYRCDFEWFAHRDAALLAGLVPEQLDQVREGTQPEGLPKQAHAAWVVLFQLQRQGRLSQTEYEDAIAQLGEEGLAELVWLDGYYSMLAKALAVFEPVLPEAARGVLSSRNERV